MEWNLLAGAQLLFFGLGAWYFWKSSRRKGAGEGLRCEDNIVEMDKLMAMEETKLTEPLAEQTRPQTLEEIGARFEVSRERVRQIEKKAFEHLSALVKEAAAETAETV